MGAIFSKSKQNDRPLASLLQGRLGRGKLSGREIDADVVAIIADYVPHYAVNVVLVNKHFAASTKIAGSGPWLRNQMITKRLLQAVAFGMESKEVNKPVSASEAGDLFKSQLFVKDLLTRSPEFLLERGDVTDWAGRTFKNITVFEYALWARDFKMIEMMLACIPQNTSGEHLRKELLIQAEKGKKFTYFHEYDRPNLIDGFPDGTFTREKETRTETHFDIGPLCLAYQNYEEHFSRRSWQQRAVYWSQLIGFLQRQLPIHFLQRFCDPTTPFHPEAEFDKQFTRSTNFYNYKTDNLCSLFKTVFITRFALLGSCAMPAGLNGWQPATDLQALLCLEKVSMKAIDRMIKQLSQAVSESSCRLEIR